MIIFFILIKSSLTNYKLIRYNYKHNQNLTVYVITIYLFNWLFCIGIYYLLVYHI